MSDAHIVAASRPLGGSLAIIVIALLVGASAAGVSATPSFAETPTPDSVASPVSTPEPTPSASADPSPSPSPSDIPVPAASPTTTPTPATPPTLKPTVPHAARHETPAVDPTNDPDAPLAAIPSATLRSTAVTLNGARFLGTVRVPLAGGATATVLKIAANGLAMARFALDSTAPAARALAMGASTLSLSGPVTLYSASLSGTLPDGTAVSFDPSSPPPLATDLPSLTNVTIALVSVTSAAASLTGATESVR